MLPDPTPKLQSLRLTEGYSLRLCRNAVPEVLHVEDSLGRGHVVEGGCHHRIVALAGRDRRYVPAPVNHLRGRRGFASLEIGHRDEARSWFLRGAFNRPRTARILLGLRTGHPEIGSEARDHNGGISELRNLADFLDRWPPASKDFFRGLWKGAPVQRVVAEVEDLIRRLDGSGAEAAELRGELIRRRNLLQSADFVRTLGDSRTAPPGRSDTVH